MRRHWVLQIFNIFSAREEQPTTQSTTNKENNLCDLRDLRGELFSWRRFHRSGLPVTLLTLSMAALISIDVSFARAQKGSSTNEGSVYAELTTVPEKARGRKNPLDSDPNAVAAGKKLFEQHCAECHGHEAEGGRRGPSLRAREVQQAPPGALFWTLSNGVVRRGMPDWSKLPEPERWQIVTYLKTLR